MKNSSSAWLSLWAWAGLDSPRSKNFANNSLLLLRPGPGLLCLSSAGRARSSQNLAKTAELASSEGDHLEHKRFWSDINPNLLSLSVVQLLIIFKTLILIKYVQRMSNYLRIDYGFQVTLLTCHLVQFSQFKLIYIAKPVWRNSLR